jgi:hypothetical protein
MNNTYILIYCLLATFLLGTWLGVTIHGRNHRAEKRRSRLSMDLYNLTTHHAVLEELRPGRISEAVEFCEHGLDYCVCSIWHQLEHADKIGRDGSLGALKRIKEYRQQWPRQIQMNSNLNEYGSKKEIQEVAERAREILTSL